MTTESEREGGAETPTVTTESERERESERKIEILGTDCAKANKLDHSNILSSTAKFSNTRLSVMTFPDESRMV